MWTICCHYHLKCISSLTPVINHKVPSPPPCYALYLSFFRSSWLIITSWPDASWDFLVMDSSSASKRVFSLTSPSAAFSPKRTFSFKATHKMQLCLLLEVEQNIISIILWYVIYSSLGLHFILQHLDRPATYVRILFVDFSSAFNTTTPSLLQPKLTQLSVPPPSVSVSPASRQGARSEAGKILIQHPYDQHWSSSGLCPLPTALLNLCQGFSNFFISRTPLT